MNFSFFQNIRNWIICSYYRYIIKRVIRADDLMSEYRKRLQLSTWPLRGFNNSNIPCDSASSAVGIYNNKKVILSVHHMTKKAASWSIELDVDIINKGTNLFPLTDLAFVKVITTDAQKTYDVDFSHMFLSKEIISKIQYITPCGEILHSKHRLLCDFEFNNLPNSSQKYGFYGQIQPNLLGRYIPVKHITITDLEFIRHENEYIVFRLPKSMIDHSLIHGCSGAPIIGEDGKTYGLVCCGFDNSDELYAISLFYMNAVLFASSETF